MNKTNFEDIVDFHEKNCLQQLKIPGFLPKDLMMFRKNFIQEEFCEFELACKDGNLEEAFDALIDMVYVILGTAYLMKLPWEKGWKEVHTCNMKKNRATLPEQSKRNSAYDVVKPDGWTSPDLKKVIENV